MSTGSNDHTQPNKTVCILGMHRSGTSFLTGTLQQQFGLELGKCHTWNPHNRKGNRENQDIVDLNDQVLSSNGGSWDSPPRKTHWSSEQLDAAASIIKSHAQQKTWGFKDPRSLITLTGWKRIKPDMEFIGIFRHPLSVAASLHKRGGTPTEDGFNLWYKYNKILLQAKKEHDFPLICFDLPENVLHEKIESAAQQIGLKSIQTQEQFYSSSLHHHKHTDAQQLPWKVKRLYNKLISLSD